MTELKNQPSAMPTRKVTAATIGAVAASISADLLVGIMPPHWPIDPTELEFLFIGLGTFAAGWFVRDRA